MAPDLHRLRAFLRFLWQRFLEDRCLQAAAALAYTSLFALVPLLATVLAIISAFPVYTQWRDAITEFVFRNFVPAAGDVVQNYFTEFAANASKATAIGILVLLFSSVSLMLSIEDAFNRIWRVSVGRPAIARFVMYWTVLTLGPLVLVATFAFSSAMVLPFLDQAEEHYALKARVLDIAPFLIEWVLLVVAYMLIPHRSVRLRHALVGAFLTAALIEFAKQGFTNYVARNTSYAQVYGALAIVPIFIFWIYLSWVIVLLGASLTASFAAFDYRPPQAPRLDRGEEFRGLLRVLARFARAQGEGDALHSADLRTGEPILTDDLVQQYLGDLERAALIQRNEQGAWALTRDLRSMSLYDLYAATNYRLPLGAPLHGASESDAKAELLLGRLQAEARARMGVPLSEIFAAPQGSEGDTREA